MHSACPLAGRRLQPGFLARPGVIAAAALCMAGLGLFSRAYAEDGYDLDMCP